MAYGDSAIWEGTANFGPKKRKRTHKITWTTWFASRINPNKKEKGTVKLDVESGESLSVIARRLADNWDKTNPHCHSARAYGNIVRFEGDVIEMSCVVRGTQHKIPKFDKKIIGTTGLIVRNSF